MPHINAENSVKNGHSLCGCVAIGEDRKSEFAIERIKPLSFFECKYIGELGVILYKNWNFYKFRIKIVKGEIIP